MMIIINEDIPIANISSLTVVINFTKKLQRFDKSVTWSRDARLALAMTTREHLKNI